MSEFHIIIYVFQKAMFTPTTKLYMSYNIYIRIRYTVYRIHRPILGRVGYDLAPPEAEHLLSKCFQNRGNIET